jgi:hypothetical protein
MQIEEGTMKVKAQLCITTLTTTNVILLGMEGYVVERENCGSELSDVLSTHSLPMTAD